MMPPFRWVERKLVGHPLLMSEDAFLSKFNKAIFESLDKMYNRLVKEIGEENIENLASFCSHFWMLCPWNLFLSQPMLLWEQIVCYD
jgi:hypothetical protein